MTTAPAPSYLPASAGTYTAEEISKSLTGYEEIGIASAFAMNISELKDNMPARALAFILAKRDGKTHDEAHIWAMSLPARDLEPLFAEDDDDPTGADLDPTDPGTEVGKDAPPQ